LIAEESGHFSTPQRTFARLWPWLSIGLTLLFIALGLWYIVRRVSLGEIAQALTRASIGYIVLSLAVMVLTIALKAWRWQWLLTPLRAPLRAPQQQTPSFSTLFWAVMLGQWLNTAVPFFRLGEIARIYVVDHQAQTGKVRLLGTLVVEKTLEMITLVLTIVALLPFIVLPEFISAPGLPLSIGALFILLALYLLAFQANLVIRLSRHFATWLPAPLARWLLQLVVSGLEGLSALQTRRATLVLFGVSLLIAVLSIVTPYLLFPALAIPFGFVEAALIHVVVSIAVTPPSTPGKIGVFDGAVAFTLLYLGLDNEAAVVSYTIIYHLVVLLPKIVLGSIAVSRTNWRRRQVEADLRSDTVK
jgi:hypothetical protein